MLALTCEITDWLQKWVAAQADGDWEHEMGLTLTVLDNPGWDLNVDLVNYEEYLQDISYTLIKNGDNNWIGYKIQDSYLNIAGDLGKLSCILDFFRSVILFLDAQATDVVITQTDLFKLVHDCACAQDLQA